MVDKSQGMRGDGDSPGQKERPIYREPHRLGQHRESTALLRVQAESDKLEGDDGRQKSSKNDDFTYCFI
jgi:hypothetical protein